MGLFRWRRITEKVNVVVEHELVLSIRFSYGASHANFLWHVSLCSQTKQAIGLHGNDFQPTSNARNDAMISETRRFAVHIKALHRDFLALERSIDGEFPTLSPQACMLESGQADMSAGSLRQTYPNYSGTMQSSSNRS